MPGFSMPPVFLVGLGTALVLFVLWIAVRLWRHRHYRQTLIDAAHDTVERCGFCRSRLLPEELKLERTYQFLLETADYQVPVRPWRQSKKLRRMKVVDAIAVWVAVTHHPRAGPHQHTAEELARKVDCGSCEQETPWTTVCPNNNCQECCARFCTTPS